MNSRILCLLFATLTMLSCRREDPNPEGRDPIYQDLLKEQGALESLLADAIKKKESAEKDFAKSAVRSIERKTAESDLRKAVYKLERINQMNEYYKIHVERRRVEGRHAYKTAFSKGEDWPNPAEFQSYLVNKRLLHASTNWEDRVPKASADKRQQINPAIGEEAKNAGAEIKQSSDKKP